MSAAVPHQASCVAIRGRGLLIEGPPGSGKSSLALALIDRGAVLVGDDGVLLEAAGGRLLASPHPAIAGKLEVRSLGLIDLPVAAAVPIALVVRLDPDPPRFRERADACVRAGVALPLVPLPAASPVLALVAERALAHFGAKF
ncbi:MAG: HPr kinase/phosphatase C-terminal domain-containing protein [Novosphingobium sp.]